MAKPKRHHYLPEAYLTGFTRGGTAESPFCVFDRDRQEFRPQTPKNTAVQGYYYTVETIDGEQSSRAEEVLSQVEGIVMPILRRIDAREPMTHADKLELSMFVALLHTRVPQFEHTIREMTNGMYKAVNERLLGSVDQAEYWIRRHEEKTGESVPLAAQELHDFVAAGEYDVIPHQNTIVRHMLDSACKFSLLLAEMTWLVAFAPEDSSFITSDAPFVMWPPEGWTGPYGFGTPGVVTMVPLSQRACLCISGRGTLIGYNNIPKFQVRQINIAVAQRCERFLIARDETLLRNIVAKSRTAQFERKPIVSVS
jgi:uncharacterized protein DUF4238